MVWWGDFHKTFMSGRDILERPSRLLGSQVGTEVGRPPSFLSRIEMWRRRRILRGGYSNDNKSESVNKVLSLSVNMDLLARSFPHSYKHQHWLVGKRGGRGHQRNCDIFCPNRSSAFIDLFNIVKLGLIDIILFSTSPLEIFK